MTVQQYDVQSAQDWLDRTAWYIPLPKRTKRKIIFDWLEAKSEGANHREARAKAIASVPFWLIPLAHLLITLLVKWWTNR